ncbi:MAG: type II toxin-antitoxin system PemK/MazF family toxin [Snowella sp.]
MPSSLQIQGVILVDQVRAVDCLARNAQFVEKTPISLLDEVLARLEPLFSRSGS